MSDVKGKGFDPLALRFSFFRRIIVQDKISLGKHLNLHKMVIKIY
jgi:hypothetical protein